MSRRRGEFEHRTSIFEGAFRAWSHLGGLEPEDLETKTAADLDPLTNPLTNDPRVEAQKKEREKKDKEKGNENDSDENDKAGGGSGDTKAASSGGESKRREYPYEPLPRSGLAHPFVQAILSPWLGPDADQDAIQLGLTTLRTWWQHRRKGESGSAIAALGTDKMRGVVEGYTRHFFNLAHCLVTNDKEQPPRTLNTKMRELEKVRTKRNKKRAREEEAGKLAALAINAGMAHGLAPSGAGAPALASSSAAVAPGGGVAQGGGAVPNARSAAPGCNDRGCDPNLTPLERLHAAQRRQLAESGGVHSTLPGAAGLQQGQIIDMKGKCTPGKLDLPSIVGQVSSHATQLAHRGGMVGNEAPIADPAFSGTAPPPPPNPALYGDPNTTPIVFVSQKGDIQIAMGIDGITCAHCVKIVETVLRGCNGNKSPINGLLDAAADMALNTVLIKIDESGSSKRIAFEAARNLAMVGYTAKAKEIDVASVGNVHCGGAIDVQALTSAFDVVASTDPSDIFNWSLPCACPDNGVLRVDCPRHSQMNKKIFEAFDQRERDVCEYMASCGKKYGMDCSCGPDCRCKKFGQKTSQNNQLQQRPGQLPANAQTMQNAMGVVPAAASALYQQQGVVANVPPSAAGVPSAGAPGSFEPRNSMMSWVGGVGRHMSVTSETTFGRAMSGLSALSIDWENMEDFDVNVDHSAHINNAAPPSPSLSKKAAALEKEDAEGIMAGCAMMNGGACNCGPSCVCVGCPVHDQPTQAPSHVPPPPSAGRRRSSLRKNNPVDPAVAQNMNVSFKI